MGMKTWFKISVIVKVIFGCALSTALAQSFNCDDIKKAVEARIVYIEAWNCVTNISCPRPENNFSESPDGVGTGLIIDDRRILTAWHVVENKKYEKKCFLVYRHESVSPLMAEFVDDDNNANVRLGSEDLAILQLVKPIGDLQRCINLNNYPLNVLRKNSKKLFYVGYDGKRSSILSGGGFPELKCNPRLLLGKCKEYNQWKFDGLIPNGHSGGPVLTASGDVVGVITSSNQRKGNTSFEPLWDWRAKILRTCNYFDDFIIELITYDRRSTEQNEVDCGSWPFIRKRTVDVPFELPPGYIRLKFESEKSEHFGSTGVTWANDNKKDATVRLFSECRFPGGIGRSQVKKCYGIRQHPPLTDERCANINDDIILIRNEDGNVMKKIDISCGLFQTDKKSIEVLYPLPPGYLRWRFSKDEFEANGTATVKWLNSDPTDATVKLYVDCNSRGEARAAITSCYAIKKETFRAIQDCIKGDN